MSRNDAGRFTVAATLVPPPAEHRIPGRTTATFEDETRVREQAAGEGDLVAQQQLTRPVSPTRVGPSRNVHARSSDDPSNYLG